MQNKKIFSVHDSKTQAYAYPFINRTAGEALRNFEISCRDENSNLNKFPSDFNLVELGEFDELTGSLIPHEKPLILSNASEYIQ